MDEKTLCKLKGWSNMLLDVISCYFEFNWSHGVGLYSGLTHPDNIADHVTSVIHGHPDQDNRFRIYSCIKRPYIVKIVE